MFFFLKDFPLVQPSIKGGRETNDRDERQNDFFRSISSSMLSKFFVILTLEECGKMKMKIKTKVRITSGDISTV